MGFVSCLVRSPPTRIRCRRNDVYRIPMQHFSTPLLELTAPSSAHHILTDPQFESTQSRFNANPLQQSSCRPDPAQLIMDRIRQLPEIPSMATYSAGIRGDVAELEAAVHVAPQLDDAGGNDGNNGEGNRRLSKNSSVSSSNSVGDSASMSDESGEWAQLPLLVFFCAMVRALGRCRLLRVAPECERVSPVRLTVHPRKSTWCRRTFTKQA